ncbi:MAG TPA: hypothetical protein PK954_11735, partial [Anaerolineales bacterium]|nr:hypothetical protein [Anaerolineales bacterium]
MVGIVGTVLAGINRLLHTRLSGTILFAEAGEGRVFGGRDLERLEPQQHSRQAHHGVDADSVLVPLEAAGMYRLAVGFEHKPQQAAMPDADDVAGVGINRAAHGQAPGIEQMAYAEPAAGAR